MDNKSRNALNEALSQTFNRETFKSMLLNRLDKRLENLVAAGQTYLSDVENVVLRADQEGWAFHLVEKAIDAAPLSNHLQAFKAAYPEFDPAKGPLPTVDYVMAHVLRGRRCFIDRTDLRSNLKQLRSADSRVLIVTGERHSGKSYTQELINFLCDKEGYKQVSADLDRYPFDAHTLAAHLGSQIEGLDPTTIPKQDQEQSSRWILRLCDWLQIRLVNSQVTYWFVIDGFHQLPLLPDTRDLISELALRAEDNLKQCRIVLLNYAEQLPLKINDFVLREQIKPIGRQELCDFFNQVNNDFGKKFTDTDLTVKVDLILEAVESSIAGRPEAQGERLHKLNLAVSDTLKVLFA